MAGKKLPRTIGVFVLSFLVFFGVVLLLSLWDTKLAHNYTAGLDNDLWFLARNPFQGFDPLQGFGNEPGFYGDLLHRIQLYGRFGPSNLFVYNRLLEIVFSIGLALFVAIKLLPNLREKKFLFATLLSIAVVYPLIGVVIYQQVNRTKVNKLVELRKEEEQRMAFAYLHSFPDGKLIWSDLTLKITGESLVSAKAEDLRDTRQKVISLHVVISSPEEIGYVDSLNCGLIDKNNKLVPTHTVPTLKSELDRNGSIFSLKEGVNEIDALVVFDYTDTNPVTRILNPTVDGPYTAVCSILGASNGGIYRIIYSDQQPPSAISEFTGPSDQIVFDDNGKKYWPIFATYQTKSYSKNDFGLPI